MSEQSLKKKAPIFTFNIHMGKYKFFRDQILKKPLKKVKIYNAHQ